MEIGVIVLEYNINLVTPGYKRIYIFRNVKYDNMCMKLPDTVFVIILYILVWEL
jgi:hypothetical protein